MTYVLFEPHHDDAVLFATYTVLKHRPHVVTVFGNAQVQAPDVECEERREEQARAFAMLGGFEWTRWLFPDTSHDSPELREAVTASMRRHEECGIAWAPLSEDGGHVQHNLVGECVLEVFGEERTRFYATYRRGRGRSRTDTEVLPQPGWAAMKFAAMGCYSSQINREDTRPWFAADDCLREWIV